MCLNLMHLNSFCFCFFKTIINRYLQILCCRTHSNNVEYVQNEIELDHEIVQHTITHYNTNMYLVTAHGLHNIVVFLGDYSHPPNIGYKTWDTYKNVICLMSLHVSTIIVFFIFLVCYWPTIGATYGHIQNMNH